MRENETFGTQEETHKTSVFLSYSRKDRTFAHRLAQALIGRGHVAHFDQSEYDPDYITTGISAEDDWWARVQEMIATAEAMLLIVSPDSAASAVCDQEIAYARSLGKRVIPLLLRPIDFASAPPGLGALNVKLSFVDDRTFDASLTALENVLDIDVAWHREGSRLVALAAKWNSAGRPESHLMPSGATADLEKWAARRPPKSEPPSELLIAYLEASRQHSKADRERLLQLTGRGFVTPAEKAFEENNYNLALRLAAAGTLLAEDLEARLVPELTRSAILSASADRLRAIIPGNDQCVERSAHSADGSLLAVVYSDNSVCVLDTIRQTRIAVLRGHMKEVSGLEFSPDSTRILTAADDGTARIWEAATGKELIVINAHKQRASAIFSPDGAYIVTASPDSNFQDHDAHVWDAFDGSRRLTLRHKQRVSGAAFTPDSAHVVTASARGIKTYWDTKYKATVTETEGTAHLWDCATGREVLVFRGHGTSIAHLRISPDAKRLFTISNDRTLKIWDLASGRELHCLQGDVAYGTQHPIGISANSEYVVAASMDRTARIWHVATGREVGVLRGHSDGINCVSFGPNSDQVLTASSDNTVATWDIASGDRIAVLHGRPHRTFRHKTLTSMKVRGTKSATFSPDGHRILALSHDGTIGVWDAATGRGIAALNGHNGPVNSAVFHPDGALVLTGSDDNTARLWSASSGDEISVFRGHRNGVQTVAISLDGTRIVTSSSDGTAKIWEARTGQKLADIRGHGEWVTSAMFSPDGARIVTSSLDDGDARVWDAATGQEIARLRNTKSDAGLAHAQFSRDGTRIVTASTDGATRIWDINSRCKMLELRGHDGWVTSASFGHNDSRLITSSRDNSARVWDATTGEEIAVLQQHEGEVLFAQLSPDGRRAATASSDRTARLWDVNNQREIAILGGHKEGVCSVAFCPDGTRVVTASSDGTARVWDVERTRHLIGDVTEIIAASLSNGRGVLVEPERQELWLKAVPMEDNDLGSALIARLEESSPGATLRVQARAEGLARLLRANCYQTPSANGFTRRSETTPIRREKIAVWNSIPVPLVWLALGAVVMLWLLTSILLAP